MCTPPISPFLNAFFVTLDNVFPLFGTVAFAVFCFYLIGALSHTCTSVRRELAGAQVVESVPRRCFAGVTIKGCTTVGLSLLVVTVHPMKPGATLMSSLLFNTALVLLATNAAIQFCAQAFALYSNQTAIQAIWGDQVPSSGFVFPVFD